MTGYNALMEVVHHDLRCMAMWQAAPFFGTTCHPCPYRSTRAKVNWLSSTYSVYVDSNVTTRVVFETALWCALCIATWWTLCELELYHIRQFYLFIQSLIEKCTALLKLFFRPKLRPSLKETSFLWSWILSSRVSWILHECKPKPWRKIS